MTESKLWPALIRARGSIEPVAKTATNPHFKNKYAPLGEVLAAVLPALAKEGIALSAFVDTEGRLAVTLTHESGEFVSSFVPLVGASDMQKLGGAMTYAMRYGVGMLLALELDDDDDGTKASAGGGQAQAATGTPRPAQGAQGSARPSLAPQPAPNRSQGKGGAHKEPVAKEDDAEAVWELARQLDEHARENPPAGGKGPFQIIKDGKLGLYGKIAERAGVEPGKYSLAQIASRGGLPRLRGFYAYLCTQNGLAGWTGGPQHKFPEQRETVPATEDDVFPPNDDLSEAF